MRRAALLPIADTERASLISHRAGADCGGLELNMGLFLVSLAGAHSFSAPRSLHPMARARPRPAGRTPCAMYGTPKYPAGFAHYDYVNPDAPKGGTLNLGNPRPRHELQPAQSLPAQHPVFLRHVLFLVRDAVRPERGRGRSDVRPGRRGDPGRSRPFVGELSHQPAGALQQRRPGDRGRCEVLRSTPWSATRRTLGTQRPSRWRAAPS